MDLKKAGEHEASNRSIPHHARYRWNLMSGLLSVQGLVKRYPRRAGQPALTAVDDVSFSAQPGQIVGLLGPNGAGKTTTIKMICGLLRPDAGSVHVDGKDLRRERAACLRRLTAVLEGNRNLYWRLTAKENLLYFAGNRGMGGRSVRQRADALLQRFGLAHKANSLVSDLSRGMQQKLALAVALLADSQLILLDEPTLGLDVEAGYEIRELLRQVAADGRTVLISSHDMAIVQDLCSRAVIISAGRVVADERVDALLQLFQTRAYSVTLADPLEAARLSALTATFPTLEASADGHTLRASLERGDDLYRLMSALQRQGASVQALDRLSVDFEQVFRRLVGGSDRPRPPRAPAQLSPAQPDPARPHPGAQP